MSKYTTEVRYICEVAAGLDESVGYDDIDEVLTDETVAKVIDFNYPLFDETYRAVLNKKILEHFYTREIGFETVGLWKQKLRARMNEIMPYYNKLYRSELLNFNPLYDVDYTTKRDGSVDKTESRNRLNNVKENESTDTVNTQQLDGNSAGHSSGYSDNESFNSGANLGTKNTEDRYSDTPQGGLTGIRDNNYLTNATLDAGDEGQNAIAIANGSESNGQDTNGNTHSSQTDIGNGERERNKEDNTNENSVGNTLEDYLEHVSGKRGSVTYSKMIMEFRDSFLNIDMMIINELNSLFMGLW